MNSAIILAGGRGSRISSDIPKQFIQVYNKKIIDFSIQAFEKNKNIDEIILVINKKWINQFKHEYNNYILVEGGKYRSDSSLKGILACNKQTSNVLIHDAARPLLTQEIINKCINHLLNYQATTPFINISDSLIQKENNIVKYLDRDTIKIIQTPQGFNKKIIETALKKTNIKTTDDISNLLSHNPDAKVNFFQGDKNNFKITNDLDLTIFKSMINED